MSELPSELAALSKAASADEQRRALAVGVAVVALRGGARRDVVAGAVGAGAVALAVEIVGDLLLWGQPDRHYGAAIAFAFVFPLAARLARRVRFARLRRRFAGTRFDEAWRELGPLVAAAWEKATPGQRAALMRITKTAQ
jgi:hypothetical protein